MNRKMVDKVQEECLGWILLREVNGKEHENGR